MQPTPAPEEERILVLAPTAADAALTRTVLHDAGVSCHLTTDLYELARSLAEGAGAAPLAALMQDKDRMAGKRVGLILTGGNIDMPVMAKVLRGETPKV